MSLRRSVYVPFLKSTTAYSLLHLRYNILKIDIQKHSQTPRKKLNPQNWKKNAEAQINSTKLSKTFKKAKSVSLVGQKGTYICILCDFLSASSHFRSPCVPSHLSPDVQRWFSSTNTQKRFHHISNVRVYHRPEAVNNLNPNFLSNFFHLPRTWQRGFYSLLPPAHDQMSMLLSDEHDVIFLCCQAIILLILFVVFLRHLPLETPSPVPEDF